MALLGRACSFDVPGKIAENFHQAILHEIFMLCWVVQGDAPGHSLFVRDTSRLVPWHGRFGRVPFFRLIPFFRLT